MELSGCEGAESGFYHGVGVQGLGLGLKLPEHGHIVKRRVSLTATPEDARHFAIGGQYGKDRT